MNIWVWGWKYDMTIINASMILSRLLRSFQHPHKPVQIIVTSPELPQDLRRTIRTLPNGVQSPPHLALVPGQTTHLLNSDYPGAAVLTELLAREAVRLCAHAPRIISFMCFSGHSTKIFGSTARMASSRSR